MTFTESYLKLIALCILFIPVISLAADYDAEKVNAALVKANHEVSQIAKLPMHQICQAHLDQSLQMMNHAYQAVVKKAEGEQVKPYIENAYHQLQALGTTHKTYCWPIDNKTGPSMTYLESAYTLLSQPKSNA